MIFVSINLDNTDGNTIDIGGNSKPSVNFGGGIELLMNDKLLNK